MKIIKKGIPPHDRQWIGHCKTCDSKAEAKQAELTHIQDDIREGSSFSWEKCPVCGAGDPKNGYGGMLFYPDKNK